MMNMSKAFDTKIQHTIQKVIGSGYAVQYLLISYRLQQENVRWRNEVSDFFTVSNGVGGTLLCVYTKGLFENLLLMSLPTLDGLQEMLQVCEDYAKGHNLRFSTNSNPKNQKPNAWPFCRK